MDEARLAIDCLHYYNLFICESESDMQVLSDTLHHLPMQPLKMVVFLLMNDAFINLLPDDHMYAPSNVNDVRDLVFGPSVDHQKCVEMIMEMLSARNYVLPAEMLSVSIDAKVYSLYNAIDDRKMTMVDLLQLGLDDCGSIASNSADSPSSSSKTAERASELKTAIDKLKEKRENYIADRSHNEQFHDLARIGYFLLAIESPIDPSLGMNGTERFLGALRLSLQHNSILDVRGVDLKPVDFTHTSINFEGSRVLITPEQVRIIVRAS